MKQDKKEKQNTKKEEKEVKKLLAKYEVDNSEKKADYCGCCGSFCA